MNENNSEKLEYWEFAKKVGLLNKIHQLTPLGVLPSCPSGRFDTHHLDELIEVCTQTPSLHIVSSYKLTLYNKVIFGADFYRLANGDPDPLLTLKLQRYIWKEALAFISFLKGST